MKILYKLEKGLLKMRLENLGVAGIHFYNKTGVVLSLEINQDSICLTDNKGNSGNLGSIYSIDGIELNMLPARHTSTKNVKFDKRKIYLVTDRTVRACKVSL